MATDEMPARSFPSLTDWRREFEQVPYWHDKPTAQACMEWALAEVERLRTMVSVARDMFVRGDYEIDDRPRFDQWMDDAYAATAGAEGSHD